MSFRISGLPVEPFTPLFGLADEALARFTARRYIADAMPGFPCRVTLEDAEPGERVLLLNHAYQPTDTPYRASHAIYVRERASRTASFVDVVPDSLRRRPLSVRAFDATDMMIDADLVDGANLEALVERLLANNAVSYLHVHYAKRGCYAARIVRTCCSSLASADQSSLGLRRRRVT